MDRTLRRITACLILVLSLSVTPTLASNQIPEPAVGFVADNLSCDGSFEVTISGTTEPGTMMNVAWRELEHGSTLGHYSVPFPGAGTHTYFPPEGMTLASDMVVNVGIGDLASGLGEPWEGGDYVEDCSVGEPTDPEGSIDELVQQIVAILIKILGEILGES